MIRILQFFSFCFLFPAAVHAEDISWFCDPDEINLTSSGVEMDGAFRFEIGVFADSFVPTPGNTGQWAAQWNAAQRVTYNPTTRRFAGFHQVTGNPAPFVPGIAAYVWGFRGDGASGEWILFRAAGWDWPDGSNILNPPVEWNAKDADAVLGTIDGSGSPFLMQSAAVANASPPKTTWAQWQAEHLAGEPLDEPGQDPDGDSIPNLLEFVFGTPPTQANSPVPTPVSLESGFATISIPRRADHVAVLVVEVSGDLVHWQSGASYTEVVSDTPVSLVVRDLVAAGPSQPQRFLRLRATLP